MNAARSKAVIGPATVAMTTLAAGIAHSQAAPPDAAAGMLEEVLVTAQRRVTNLQATAAAITAVSEDDLQARSIGDVQDLGRLAPSMDVSIYQGEAQIYIRGIGYTGLIGGTDSSTAFHLNGVYLSRSAGAIPGFFDVERVEVLRGPQGTLYGRNATGGSVNVISKGPSSQFASEAELTVGNYNHYRVLGALGGPLGSERVAARLAVQVEQRDGYTDATRPDGSKDDIEDQRDIMARLSVRLEPADNFTIDLIGDYYEADDAASVWLYFGPGAATNPFLRQYIAAQGGVVPPVRSRDIGSDVDAFNRPKIWGGSGKLTWAVGDYTLSSLSAYRVTRPRNFNDLDVTIANAITQFRSEDDEQLSEELQIVSPAGRDFEWLLGAYYIDESNDVRNQYLFPFIDDMFGLPADPTCCKLRLDGQANTEASAIFGEANYDFTDKLNVVVGGRYSRERRSGRNDVEFVNFLTPLFDNQTPFEPATFTAFTPKVGLNYQLSDAVFAYASASRGFKSGGFNIGSYQNTPFNPEKIWSYEAGVKTDLLERRLRLNLAAFYYDYTDLQVQDVEGNNTVVRNAASAVIQGLELETTALLGTAVQIDLAATYLNSEFRDSCLADPKHPLPQPEPGCTGPSQRNLEGLQLPRAPELKLSVGAQYTLDLPNTGQLILRGDYSHQSRIFFSAFEVTELSQEGYGWAKARLAYVAPGAGWQLAAFIDNITDEEVISNATYIADLVDSTITGNMAPPRTYGVQFKVQF